MGFVWIVRFLLSAVALASAMPAAAQSFRAGTPVPVCIARAVPGLAAQTVFDGHVKLDCTREQYRLGPGDYWAISPRLADRATGATVYVRISSLWQKRLTVHARYADGAVVVRGADQRTLSRHIQLGAIVEFALPPRASPLVQLLWHVEGSANARGIVLNQRIATAAQSAHANIGMAAIYGGFVGLGIALLVYNLALWGVLRHRFQLAYCAMVATLIVYAISSSGVLAWAFPAIPNNDRLRLNYLMLALSAATALTFARSFFEARVFEGWLGRYTTAATILIAASGVGFAALAGFDMRLADSFYAWGITLGLTVVAPMLWRAWRRRSDFLWLFAIAWSVPMLFAAARILSAIHVIPTDFWLDNSTLLSMAFEALVSSIAIAYRVQTLSCERDAAVAGETIARHLADVDPLTGLLNRRAFLAQAVGRDGTQILHVIDIDHFKHVNETLGHDGGDEVLRVFARTLRALVPPGALVARIGGEEFAIVTDAAESIEPDAILARLREARMPFDLSVTASVGSCVGPLASEIDWKKLYHNADRALFTAKSDGRDRARNAPPLAIAA